MTDICMSILLCISSYRLEAVGQAALQRWESQLVVSLIKV